VHVWLAVMRANSPARMIARICPTESLGLLFPNPLHGAGNVALLGSIHSSSRLFTSPTADIQEAIFGPLGGKFAAVLAVMVRIPLEPTNDVCEVLRGYGRIPRKYSPCTRLACDAMHAGSDDLQWIDGTLGCARRLHSGRTGHVL
jgi:hypothetical protein